LLPDGALFLGRNVFWFLPKTTKPLRAIASELRRKKKSRISEHHMDEADDRAQWTQHDLKLQSIFVGKKQKSSPRKRN